MTYPAEHTPTQRIKSAKPSSNTAPDSADPRQPSEADRSFIRSMNEFVEKMEPLLMMSFSGCFNAETI